jgi:predicted RNase H-like nuclease
VAWVAGADACKAGWFCVVRELETGSVCPVVASTSEALLAATESMAVLAIDIPIGLPNAGKRECDVLARQCLGWPRRNSVFSAPIRSAVAADNRAEASRITEGVDGRRVAAQAYGIYAKTRSLDGLLALKADVRTRIYEVHPEVCFWAWNEERAMLARKKSQEGKRGRLRLVDAWLGSQAFTYARESFLKASVADDDILDAFAALWTATRIFEGQARTLPEVPPLDAMGLPMRIVY